MRHLVELVIAGLTVASAPALADRPMAAPLDVQGEGVPAAVLAAFTGVLRGALRDDGAFVPIVPRAALLELRLLLDCPELNPACWQAIARSLKAELLIVAEVRREGPGYRIRFQRLDGASGQATARSEARIEGTAGPGVVEAFARAAARFLRGLGAGVLAVSATPGPAAVYLAGQFRGETPTRLEVRPGRHQLEVRQAGRRPHREEVEVAAGATVEIHATLAPLAGAPPPEPRPEPPPRRRLRPVTWVAFAGAGLALAAGTALGVAERTTQSDYDSITPRTRAEVDRMGSLRDRGRALGLGANVAFGVGGAALVAAGVLTYFDLRRVLPERAALRLHPGPATLVLAGEF